MKFRFVLVLAALAAAGRLPAQPFVLDCTCLATQSVLLTNACQAVVPDLCQFTNCYYSLMTPPVPLMCSQSPAAGSSVGAGAHPVTVTVSDPGGNMLSCALLFIVNAPPGGCDFTLLCASNKTVSCDATWNFDPPAWTNACIPPIGVPSNGVVVTVVSTVTNGFCPTLITRTWQAVDDCMQVATCSQTVTVVDTNPPALDCSCLTNHPALPPLQLTVTNCTDVIPDLCAYALTCATDNCGPLTCTQSPPAGTIVGPGVYSITVSVFDCAGASASCLLNFTVVEPPDGCGGCTHPAQFYSLHSGRAANGTLLPAAAVDPQFDLQGPSAPPNPVVITTPNGSWLPNSAGSQWIGPNATAGSGAAAGLFAYTNRFYLCATNEAVITGRWTVDDGGAIHLNGATTGNDINTPLAFAAWQPVSITSGFQAGWNALVFYVTNFDGPTGLRVELAGTNCADTCCCTNNGYDFLAVTIPGAYGQFTSPNGNGFITAQTAGGPFMSFNNTVYASQFPNLFPGSGTVPGYVAQSAGPFSVTFNLTNYALSPCTVFGIWNITEETDLYKIEVFDCNNVKIAPPFPPYFNFLGWDDDALSGNIGWHHMTLNPTTGNLSTSQFKPGGTDCDAAFWNNLPAGACSIVVTGNLGPADGVVFYFAEPKPCCEVVCPTNLTVTTCGTNAILTFPAATLTGPCFPDVDGVATCVPPSGSTFPLGVTTVTCAATRNGTVLATCSFTVTVVPGGSPWNVICPPPSLSVTGCPPVMPNLSNLLTIVTNCPLACPVIVTQQIAPGTVLAPGTHVVIVRACDCTGRCFDCDVTVTAVNTPGCCVPGEQEIFSGARRGGLIMGGKFDPQFSTSGPFFTTTQPYVIFDFSLGSGWILNSPASKWVGPDPAPIFYPPGVYAYETRFFLPCVNQARIFGRWTADDTGTIWLNGTPTGVVLPPTFAFTSWHPVSITSGFVPGWNTLTFYVTNVVPGSPTGLRTELIVTNCCPPNCVTLDCPTNMTVGACGGLAVVNYPAICASSACATGAMSISCVPPSGSVFPLGTNAVQCTAVDSQGNAATCSFTVTVFPLSTPPCIPAGLSISLSNGTVTISWPALGGGTLVAATNSDSGSTIFWSPVMEPPQLTAGTNYVRLPVPGPYQLFQLR
jgi:hypothetical protein